MAGTGQHHDRRAARSIVIDVDGACRLAGEALRASADPDAAEAMMAYMKTDMAFYGVKAPERKHIARGLYVAYPPIDADDVWSLVDGLWSLPHREEKYLAVGFARQFRQLLDASQLERVAGLIVAGAWWDFVDEIAVHIVGDIVRREPGPAWPVIEAWNEHDDLWLRRTSLICQVASKRSTDADRLFRFCLARASERGFFIRKAIGWALRQYSWIEPDAVRRFLAEHGERLSGLSRREAAKHLTRIGERS